MCVTPLLQDEVSHHKEAIAQMQCELAAFEKTQAKGKAKEEEQQQLQQTNDEQLEKDYEG